MLREELVPRDLPVIESRARARGTLTQFTSLLGALLEPRRLNDPALNHSADASAK